jgi:hypothetical protein
MAYLNDDAEAKKATFIVRFEWEMLLAAAAAIETPALFAKLEEVNGAPNAAMEAFAIHARNLIHFLYTPSRAGRPNPDDILAADIVNGWSEPETATRGATWLQASKKIAHIGRPRLPLPLEGESWAFTSIKSELGAMVDKFIARVPDVRLHVAWVDAKSKPSAPGVQHMRLKATGMTESLLVPRANSEAFTLRAKTGGDES